MRTLLTLAAVAALTLPITSACGQTETDSEPEKAREFNNYEYVTFETSMGEMLIELNYEKAPISVENFVQYIEDGHYDGTVFHRVMSNFMIQGGGFTVDAEQKDVRDAIKNEWKNGLSNTKFSVAMARLGRQPDSATAQFFINVSDNAFLDQPRDGAGYAVFGEVIDGKDVVDAIRQVQTAPKETPNGAMNDWPVENVVIKKAQMLPEDEASKLRKERIAERERIAKELAEADVKLWTDALAQAKELIASQGYDVSEGYMDTETGVWTLIVEKGNDVKPEPTDGVRVHYTGWFPNGKKFDSSRDRGAPMDHVANGFIAGWNDTLVKMGEGGRRFLVIPYDKAYGKAGRSGIPPKAVLVFDMELVKVL